MNNAHPLYSFFMSTLISILLRIRQKKRSFQLSLPHFDRMKIYCMYISKGASQVHRLESMWNSMCLHSFTNVNIFNIDDLRIASYLLLVMLSWVIISLNHLPMVSFFFLICGNWEIFNYHIKLLNAIKKLYSKLKY